MLIVLRTSAIALFAALVAVWPAVAAACSCWAAAISNSEPVHGATDVPRNQALVVRGLMKPESLKLEDAQGAQVEFDLEHGPSPGCEGTWAELRPKPILSAMTTYTIRVEPNANVSDPRSPTSLTFTTGTRVLAEQTLATPKARVSVIEGIPPSVASSCGSAAVQACVSLEDFKDVEMIARRRGEIISRWIWQAEKGNYAFTAVPDCLEFRRRAATGQRSEPLMICGEALGLRPYRTSDGDGTSIRCDDSAFGAPEPAVSSEPPSRSYGSDAAVDSSQNDTAVDSLQSDAAVEISQGAAAVDVSQSDAAVEVSKSEASNDVADPAADGDGCSLKPSGRAPGVSALLMLLFALATRGARRSPR